jgi:hypothetical protein
MPNFQGVWSLSEQYQNRVAWGPPAPVGLFAVGSTLNKITISTTGNATNFGSMSQGYNGGCSSSTRMLIARGNIEYVEFATGGSQSTFGVLDPTLASEVGGLSSQTRGVFFGGLRFTPSYGQSNQINYVTIATTGNPADFGDMTISARGGGGCASPTRGLMSAFFSGGGEVNNIMYITIASTGNATDFGDRTVSRVYSGGCSNSTRGMWGGGGSGSATNVIDYVTIASTGNATDFGDLTQARREGPGALASPIRAVWGGGYVSSYVNTMDYVTIASTGNAADFGDLVNASTATGGSNAHGGLAA